MISRRQLRVKVLQTLYAYFKTEDGDISRSEKELLYTINKAYELYHSIFILLIELVNHAEIKIDLARKKLVPTEEDLHPNTRFIESRLIDKMRNSEQLIRFAETKKITWVNYPELIKGLYTDITNDPVYLEFMAADTASYSDEIKLFTHILTAIVYPSEELEQVLEEKSIYWTDDLEYMISMAIKTLRRFREDDSEPRPLLDLFKNPDNKKVPEDKEFAIELFRKTILHRKEYTEYIKSNTTNWDLERIAFMDILMMQMAITEFVEFSSIPVKVTLNEYLEISKVYSTSKSSVFINGVLDKVVGELRSQKKIQKTGRGLIE